MQHRDVPGIQPGETRRGASKAMRAEVSKKKSSGKFNPLIYADVKSQGGAKICRKKHPCFAFFASFAVKSAEHLLIF
jgi:hypothetical protein